MLIRLGRAAERWTKTSPWSNVYGLARTLLALATAGTIAFNAPHEIFRPSAAYADAPVCEGYYNIGIFCVFKTQLELSRWVALGILAMVAAGWRPRFTAVLHWWVSFSVLSSSVGTGGDKVSAVLTLLLIPLALTDGRRWHWASAQEQPAHLRGQVTRLVALSALTAVRLQVAGIYFVAAVAKFGVTEWANGTALYYWMADPRFGGPGWVLPILRSPAAVTALTWGTILLELALALALLFPSGVRRLLLVMGIVFHVSIALLIGITSFSMTMIGALVLYLRPYEAEFKIPPTWSGADDRAAPRRRSRSSP